MAELTPMRKQYIEMKRQYADCILFFRLGDFYEMFDDDALLASKELDLTLTTRDRTKAEDERVPMCGVPYHSAEAYIARLIAKGYKVAICEQTEDPATAKGLVDRDVIRIVTPGTLLEPSMLEEGRSNYLCAVYADENGAAACFADISTGETSVVSFPGGGEGHIRNELARVSPAEAVLSEGAAALGAFLRERLGAMAHVRAEDFDAAACEKLVCEQYGVEAPAALGLGAPETAALGALLRYVFETQKSDSAHLSRPEVCAEGRYMELDIQASRHLELTCTMRTLEKKGSLLWVLDKTKTPMGSRLLRSWVSHPLLSPAEISKRLSAVSELVGATAVRGETIAALKNVGDMERLLSKAAYGTANARDLAALCSSLAAVPAVRENLAEMKSAALADARGMDGLEDICQLLARAVCDDPPFSVREGGMLRDGYDAEVDELRGLLKNSGGALADIEAREKERTGKKLKVGYNRVFGYYIEIPRSASSDVPEDYVRKQTLTNCERFITQELKELETKLLTARDRLAEREYALFCELLQTVAENGGRIQRTAAAVAGTDVLCSLAETAVKNGYCRPEVDLSGVIEIKGGRHPVVELLQKDALFVPNDAALGLPDCRTAIITGPNMAGKSTYMRQTALIVLMAQMGSFVPAQSAHIGVVDRVFTRIGASDDLSAGKSTFMVEMTEVAEIMKNATSKSLLILDEIGRGTSTYDGMAIARAVLEACSDPKKLGAKTMFATHYHELTVMEKELPGVKNFSISAKKRGGDLVFLRRIVPGAADESYGIEVAHLAGVPESVIRRARVILDAIEADKTVPAAGKPKPARETAQLTLEDMGENEITETLKKTDLNTITPIEAMNLLFELKKKVR
ncbi:MAG: DNA mismatch repair protein MutS [Oscillospiraceae bacterium]|nr:DNA mismatch repair protein MutS [Oscillospiraceae bacterium]